MKRLMFLLLLLSFSIGVSAARMYQWIDPDTGTTQLSGKPPHWYRTGEAGPRVIVFDSGKVIDDTGIELSEAENTRLRQQALIIVENDRLVAMQKLAGAQQQKAAFDSDPEAEEEQAIFLPESSTPPPEEEAPETDETVEIAEQMRQLLEQYESLRTQDARELVETGGP